MGSTGKDVGDRHPHIDDDVLIGCNAIVLGNISIGKSVKIGSGSVVIKSIPAFTTAVGNPARIVGKTYEKSGSAAKEMDLALAFVKSPCGALFRDTFTLWANGNISFEDIDTDSKGYIDHHDLKHLFKAKLQLGFEPSDECIAKIFPIFDENKDGKICKIDYTKTFTLLSPLFKHHHGNHHARQKSSHESNGNQVSSISTSSIASSYEHDLIKVPSSQNVLKHSTLASINQVDYKLKTDKKSNHEMSSLFLPVQSGIGRSSSSDSDSSSDNDPELIYPITIPRVNSFEITHTESDQREVDEIVFNFINKLISDDVSYLGSTI